MSISEIFPYFVYFAAYATAILAFSFNSLFWLRLLTAISSSCYVLYYFIFPAEPLWLDILTEGALVLVNVVMLLVLTLKRGKSPMSSREKEIHEGLFYELSQFEFYKILKTGKWQSFKPGKKLLNQGEKVEAIYLVYTGEVEVVLADENRITLRDGALLGEMSFVSDEPANADVYVTAPSEMLVWDQGKLWKLLEKNPALKIHFSEIINKDLMKKLGN